MRDEAIAASNHLGNCGAAHLIIKLMSETNTKKLETRMCMSVRVCVCVCVCAYVMCVGGVG
jgi:hypothetical protein